MCTVTRMRGPLLTPITAPETMRAGIGQRPVGRPAGRRLTPEARRPPRRQETLFDLWKVSR